MVEMTTEQILENDTEQADAHERHNNASCRRDGLFRRLHQRAGDPHHRLTNAAVLSYASDDELTTLGTLNEEVAHFASVIAYAERRWLNHGQWSRYFEVRGNRIHSTRHCGRLGPNTRLLLLAEFSGQPPDAVVARYGGRLCRSCFPNAPEEWTSYGKRHHHCPGSGMWMPWRYEGDYELCPRCGQKVRCTAGGKLRKHPPKI